MKKIRLLDLGNVPAVRSQTCYHAVAYCLRPNSPDTIVLVSPAEPYVCIGFHQNLEKEVDVEYCRSHNLPVFRREVGGGAVYLDNNQLFAQWIFQPQSLPTSLEQRFALYVKPLVETYQAMGIDAYLRPVNDIHVDGKKIGGTGAAQIGEAEVAVGSFMFDFDKAAMARVLKVPSQKMRDKIYESLGQYMTTMKEQLDTLPDRRKVKDLYIKKCAESLNAEIVIGSWTDEEETMARELDERFRSPEWLHQKSSLQASGVKIHEDVKVVESAFKAPGGLIRVTMRLHGDKIEDISISGDFTLFPASAVGEIERALRGSSVKKSPLETKLKEIYHSLHIQSPGVELAHFVEAMTLAVEK